MELKQHWQILKRHCWGIILFGIVVAAVAGVVTWQRPASYKTIIAFEVQLTNRTGTADYQYGSYYDLKGAEIFSQYLMSLLRSPAVIEDMYQTAGLPYTIDNVDQFTNQFRGDQGAAQLFTVTYSQYNHAAAEQLATGMTTVLAKHAAQAEIDSTGNSLFSLSANDPVIVYQEPSVLLSVVVGAVAGWIVAIVAIYLKRYLE
jgi:capsular polysaccharide biosynthesis protein